MLTLFQRTLIVVIAFGFLVVALVVADIVALEVARRVWQRGEVIGRL